MAITLACAGFFLGIKAVEYSTKWDEGLLWASAFKPVQHVATSSISRSLMILSLPAILGFAVFAAFAAISWWRKRAAAPVLTLTMAATCAASFAPMVFWRLRETSRPTEKATWSNGSV